MIRLVCFLAGIVIGVIFHEQLIKIWNAIYAVIVSLINWIKTILETA